MLVVVDVFSRLLVAVLVLVVVSLLVLVRVVVLVLMHTPSSLSLPLLEQAGRGARGCNKKDHERQEVSSHSDSSQLKMLRRLRCLIFPTSTPP